MDDEFNLDNAVSVFDDGISNCLYIDNIFAFNRVNAF